MLMYIIDMNWLGSVHTKFLNQEVDFRSMQK